MEHLLVALDYAGCAHEVVLTAAPLAEKLGAKVSLLYVIKMPEGVEPSAGLGGELSGRTALSALDIDARHALHELAVHFRDRGVRAGIAIRHGSPVKRILEAAEELSADMIIMGTHGRTGLPRFVMGSVAEKVIRTATVPVLTVRTQVKDLAGPSAVQQQVRFEEDG